TTSTSSCATRRSATCACASRPTRTPTSATSPRACAAARRAGSTSATRTSRPPRPTPRASRSSSAIAVLELGLAALRLAEREPARADRVVQLVLDLVHSPCARLRLGPEVPRVAGRAAELEADAVVPLLV